jgi:hypothetical protein
MLVGVANVFVQKFRKSCRWMDMGQLFPELANGVAMPPVLMLIAGAFASSLLTLLEQASRPTLFLSGLAAMWALLDISYGRKRSGIILPRSGPRW